MTKKGDLERYDFITHEPVRKSAIVRCPKGKKISTFDLLRILRNCFKEGLILDSMGETFCLDSAVMAFSEEANMPVFVSSDKEVMILKTTYAKNIIFDLKNIPEQYVSGIFYKIPISKIPEKMHPYLIII